MLLAEPPGSSRAPRLSDQEIQSALDRINRKLLEQEANSEALERVLRGLARSHPAIVESLDGYIRDQNPIPRPAAAATALRAGARFRAPLAAAPGADPTRQESRGYQPQADLLSPAMKKPPRYNLRFYKEMYRVTPGVDA